MIKSAIFLFLALASTTQAFAPTPAFSARRVMVTTPSTNNLVFMAPPTLEEVTESVPTESINGANVSVAEIPKEEEKEMTETQKLMKQVKESGTAGIVSYALWELAFWFVSIPVCIFGYREVAGHWPDLSNSEDMSKLGAEAFAFVNFARFAVPLRIGLALSTTPWIQANVIDKFKKDDKKE